MELAGHIGTGALKDIRYRLKRALPIYAVGRVINELTGTHSHAINPGVDASGKQKFNCYM